MTNSRLHDDIASPVRRLPLRPNGPPPASGGRLRRGPDTSARERERELPVDLAMQTSPDSSVSAPASQHEFYQYVGLALLALIAISILVAARG